jgi:hypothetical protein
VRLRRLYTVPSSYIFSFRSQLCLVQKNNNMDLDSSRVRGPDSRYNPETPFGVCDTPETVAQLKARLAHNHIHVVNVEGLNPSGCDCVFLAMMYGVRPNTQGRRVVKDMDNNGVALDMGQLTVDDVRNRIAHHIIAIWNKEQSWVRRAIRMHIMYEARSYLQLDASVDLATLRDAYCDAIRGVNGRQRMFGDLGVQLAFASLFKATVVCWVPPRPTANAARNMLYRPLMFGSSTATHVEPGARTSCLMMFYVLQEGVGHGEPLLADSAQHGRPSRFTGTYSPGGSQQCMSL